MLEPNIKKEAKLKLSTLQMEEMRHFYLTLLKMLKKRPNFNVDRVMQEVYTHLIFKKFLKKYKENSQ